MSLCERCDHAGLLYNSPTFGDRVECIDPAVLREIRERIPGKVPLSRCQPQKDDCPGFVSVLAVEEE